MIDADDVFRAFQQYRGNAVVIPTGTSGRGWRAHSTNEKRDLNLGGAMGHTTSAALGLALGIPNEKVVLFDSEGALTMNMGILATIAGKKPSNFLHILLDNECYATTGGQPVPNAQEINYAGMAKEAGYRAGYNFDNIEDFATNIESIMKEEGPVFVGVKVVPQVENEPIGMRQRAPQRSRAETIRDLQAELGIPAR
ncbi:MAG: thiamine pyrophosphate-dependent enzyme [Dehalococcoidia bacterium]